MTTYVVRSWTDGDEQNNVEMEYFGSLAAARAYIEDIKADGCSGELLLLVDEFVGEQDAEYYYNPAMFNGIRPGVDCPAYV